MNIPEGLPLLFADARQVRDMMMRLVSNAIRFTLAGGVVRCSAEVDAGNRFVFTIRDSGIGIAPNDLRAITGAPESGGDVLASDLRGPGLGLALSRKLAEMHGGELIVDSELGVGTTVTVRFPAGRTTHS